MWLIVFMIVCVAHLCEHIAQAVQVYALGMELHQSRGIIGQFYPWVVHSETLHYGYALAMLSGLWLLRNHMSGKARKFWMMAFYIQVWHHFEHALLLYQATTGANFFGAPAPISVAQFLGFFNGPAENGFDGLLKMSHFGVCTCEGAAPGTVHSFSWLLLLVRRVELHLIYNTLVIAPMVAAVYHHTNGFWHRVNRGSHGPQQPLADLSP